MAKHIRMTQLAFILSGLLFHPLCNASLDIQYKKSLPKYNTMVIADHGGESIERYLPTDETREKRLKETWRDRASKRLVNAHFPVVSKSLSVGRVTPEEAQGIKHQIAGKPMFIIGYDHVSIKWLKKNSRKLADKGAIGLVVNVDTQEQMNELQVIAGKGVLMQPTPGDRLAKHLKIKHYPFYMDNNGVMR